jgi:Fic family protein
MIWNWQLKNWPKFSYDRQAFVKYEEQFLHEAGIMHGSLKHVNDEDQQGLKVDLISDEAYKTSEIEGEILNRDSLQSSIRKHFGLKTDNRKIPPAENGISEMMISLYQTYQSPLEHQQLYEWHEMLTSGRRDLIDIGRYRTHEDPMQIVSGAMHKPNVHFEAPPSKVVKKEMKEFVEWFNSTVRNGKIHSNLIERAAIAHLYFESIHPFEDGNGRIGRAISEKALSQGLGRPTLIAISRMIEADKKNYYEALHRNSVTLDVSDWMEYFYQLVLQAQDYTQSLVDFLIEKAKFYARFDGKLNERQHKVVTRMFREGPEGFKGGLSADNYIRITGTTSSTATRDLQKLVEMGAMKRTGERKSTRYSLNIDQSID